MVGGIKQYCDPSISFLFSNTFHLLKIATHTSLFQTHLKGGTLEFYTDTRIEMLSTGGILLYRAIFCYICRAVKMVRYLYASFMFATCFFAGKPVSRKLPRCCGTTWWGAGGSWRRQLCGATLPRGTGSDDGSRRGRGSCRKTSRWYCQNACWHAGTRQQCPG